MKNSIIIRIGLLTLCLGIIILDIYFSSLSINNILFDVLKLISNSFSWLGLITLLIYPLIHYILNRRFKTQNQDINFIIKVSILIISTVISYIISTVASLYLSVSGSYFITGDGGWPSLNYKAMLIMFALFVNLILIFYKILKKVFIFFVNLDK